MRALSLALLALMAQPALAGTQCGIVSYYGTESGSRTANGERFTGGGMTAAHRSLAFGTVVTVRWGQRSVRARINDRGPAAWTGASLDLSRHAAEVLGMIGPGRVRACWSW